MEQEKPWQIIILSTHGTVLEENREHSPELSEMQGAVGGYIEAVPSFIRYENKPCVAFCNENGKLEGLDVNLHATQLWWSQAPQFKEHDILVGDIVVIVADPEKLKEL